MRGIQNSYKVVPLVIPLYCLNVLYGLRWRVERHLYTGYGAGGLMIERTYCNEYLVPMKSLLSHLRYSNQCCENTARELLTSP
jgi:hypothetical protein